IGDFKCNKCDKLFIQQNCLDRHCSIEHPINNEYLCAECKKSFATKELIIDHMRIHPLKSVKCSDCNREFTRKYHLDRHIGQTGCMGIPKKVYDCRVRFIYINLIVIINGKVRLQSILYSQDNLAEHLRAHAGQVKEEDIPLRLSQKKLLYMSVIEDATEYEELMEEIIDDPPEEREVHDEEKVEVIQKEEDMFECDICHKTFKTNAGLKRHITVNHGDNDMDENDPLTFQLCPWLWRTFGFCTYVSAINCLYNKTAWDRHCSIEQSVNNEYLCAECAKSFATKELIIDHMRIHPLLTQSNVQIATGNLPGNTTSIGILAKLDVWVFPRRFMTVGYAIDLYSQR
ncbi:hypothetical protein NQ317_012106, partial [Molorchus minor]